MALAKGTAAPDFTLKGTTAEPVTLSSHKGKDNVVLLFYPFDFSGVCTEEFCGLRDNWAEFSKLTGKVYGISVDSPHSHNAFKKANNLPFELLSDFNKEVSKKYDVFYEDLGGWKGVSKRSAFVIGKDGKIAYSWSSDDPKVKPDVEVLKKELKALK